MADQMTSFDVIGRHYQQQWYYLEEQAQDYPINVYLFRMFYLYSGWRIQMYIPVNAPLSTMIFQIQMGVKTAQ